MHFSEYSFPFFTSTISVGRGCNLIAQHKTELWESHLLSELTFQQKFHSVEPAIIASEETDIAGKRLDLHVLVNRVKMLWYHPPRLLRIKCVIGGLNLRW